MDDHHPEKPCESAVERPIVFPVGGVKPTYFAASSLALSGRAMFLLVRNPHGKRLLAVVVGTMVLSVGVRAAEPPQAGGVDFARQIRPILAQKCWKCHGPDPDTRAAGLRLDTREGATGVLESGQRAIVPGHPQASELMRRVVASGDERMPPDGEALTAAQIDLLRRWVLEGGNFSSHWAYIAPRRPDLPRVTDPEWPRGPIDRFVLARLEAEGLRPSPAAEPAVLLRRVHLDLVGLPPSVEEIEAFERDPSPQAYEAVVDALLASPRFGEKWARQWLDLARYADSNGYQGDALRTNWPWRDWVIRALNEDMPFDQFTIAQVAGDILAGDIVAADPDASDNQPCDPRYHSPDELRMATAFFRHAPFNAAGDSIAEEVRANQLFDRVSTLGVVWLAATLECAQCHSHKFDPVTIADYYGLYAYFNSAVKEFDTGEGVRKRFRPPALLKVPLAGEALAAHESLQTEISAVTKELDAVRPNALAGQAAWEATAKDDPDVQADIRRLLAKQPGERRPAELEDIEKFYLAQAPETKQLVARRKELGHRSSRLGPPTVLVLADDPAPRPTHIFRRGDYREPTERVEPGTPACLHPLPAGAPPNRLGLARWLIDQANPLTARVTVNRWWSELFGRGIVSTTDDFGTQGAFPTHPELLDWLATELATGERPWSMKRILRAIVTSATYRQSSSAEAERFRRDPHNELLARGPRVRLNAEMIRDQALAVSGCLSGQVGGPPAYPPQPPNLWQEITGNEDGPYPAAEGADRFRRGIYTVYRRGAPHPAMQAFDWPDRSVCVAQRPVTNTPAQALVLLNDPAFLELYVAFARRIMSRGDGDEGRINWAFRACVARRPVEAEVRFVAELLRKKRLEFAADPQRAEQLLSPCDVSPEHRTAELAAWSLVARALMNLDETITRN
jgi:hypothetical protein